ncbi:MAG: helix-turn-helix transcriptional regulator [Chloroflexi bacterium]|nr:MAG: helix-turn-helix transcriptional regulator [Chloroflexota bacterium]
MTKASKGEAQLTPAAWRDGAAPSRGRRQEIEAEARRIRLRGGIEGWPRDTIVDEVLRRLPDVTPLEAHRFARGWTREELSQAVDLLYVTDGLDPPQLSSAELCRWEHGQRRPSDERREYLCRVYRTRPDRLGFGSDHTPRPTGETTRSSGRDRVEYTAPGGPLDAHSRGFGADREALRPEGIPTNLTIPVVEGVEAITNCHRTLYWMLPAVHLLRPVIGHLGLGISLMRGSVGPPALRRRVTLAGAETALLAGRVLFFDLRREADARRCLGTALDLALDAGDHQMAAAVFGHMAFIPGFAGDLAGAQDCMRGARHHAQRQAAADVEAWLAAAESEVYARGGDITSGLAAALRAEERYEAVADDAAPPWFDWFSRQHLASFAGYAHLRAGHLPAARGRLASALQALPAESKQRAILLADMAGVEIEVSEIEEACRLLADALSNLAITRYATGFERVREVRARLEQWRDDPAVRDLDEILYGSGSGAL